MESLENQSQIDFDKKKFNNSKSKPRIHTFDLARGIAILFMIMQHSVLIYGNLAVKSSFIGLLIIALGTIPAAPVFLFLMGVCFKYIEQDAFERFRYGIRRGIKLFFLGYFLNVLRFTVPLLVGLGEFELNLYKSDISIPITISSSFFIVDILQCAGLSMIVMSVFTRYFKKDSYFILIALFIAFVSPFLWGIMTTLSAIDFFLNIIWGTNPNVFFPIFPWMSYPFVGMAFGQRFRFTLNIDQLISTSRNFGICLFIISILIALRNLGRGIIVIGSIINLLNPLLEFNSHEHPSPIGIILIIGFVLIWLWLCHLFVKKLPQNIIYDILFYWSKKVTVMYFFQWIFIGWGIFIFGYQSQNLLMTLFLFLSIILITHLFSFLILRLKGPKRSLTKGTFR
ncbi:MAG: heparan-alpha-glucosaminide N-acetyltransferase domain-containing protein [Candidatus Hodarchaeota archaeon]